MASRGWWGGGRHRLSQAALQRQVDYQKHVAQQLRDLGDPGPIAAEKNPPSIDELLSHAHLPERPRVLEVGTAGRGLLRYLPSSWLRVGVDPLSLHYRFLFPPWTRRVQTCAAFGEELPFGEEAFDLVLFDNVIYHPETPAGIRLGRALGIRLELGPFADHPFHFTEEQVRQLLAGLPLRVLVERCDVNAARQ